MAVLERFRWYTRSQSFPHAGRVRLRPPPAVPSWLPTNGRLSSRTAGPVLSPLRRARAKTTL